MARYGIVVDLNRCTGCRACMAACKVENNTLKASFWMYMFRFEQGTYPNVRVTFLPRPCMHCANAPCAKVCPVAARHIREDGLVLTDFDRCIGCRYCQVACPYGVNVFNWKNPRDNQYLDWGKSDVMPPYHNPDLDNKYGSEERLVAGGGHYVGVMEKCTFCVHRVAKGLLPACVTACPESVLLFGDLEDPNSDVSKLLVEKPSFRLLEELGTEPNVYYVGGAPPTETTKQIEGVPIGSE